MHNKETLAIVEALAEGINPVTGETLPEISPYNDPLVIRALFQVGQLLRQQLSPSEPPRHLPARAGSPWDAEEDKGPSEEFEANLPIRAMAEKHQRTSGAIQSRLVSLGLIERQPALKSMEVTSNVAKQWWKEQGRTQAGKPWTKKDDDVLLRDFRTGVPLENIAEMLKRGINAVEVRLAKLGIRQSDDD